MMMRNFLLFLLGTIVFLSCQGGNDTASIKPQQKDIVESVYASVTVKPAVSYTPQSIRAGVIEKIYVEEGDEVKKGQLLFQIQPTTRDKGQLTDAKINLEEAKANYLGDNNMLRNIQLEIQKVQEQITLDSINLQRQERLLAQNIGKRIDYDQLKVKYENGRNQLRILRQKLAQTQTNLENNYKKAKNRIAIEQGQLADFKVRSEMDGKLYVMEKEVGDFISSQQALAEIGSSEQFKIEMDIDEVDIIKIAVGDSVLIVLDAYPDDVFVARIHKIFDKKNSVTQTFRVEAVFEEVPPKLYYGLSGEGNIVVSQRANALVIPTEYLLPNNKVMTAEGEKSVTVGMKNLEYTEIISGIDTATTIIKPTE